MQRGGGGNKYIKYIKSLTNLKQLDCVMQKAEKNNETVPLIKSEAGLIKITRKYVMPIYISIKPRPSYGKTKI